MFDENSLRELASVVAKGPILSVYLDVDPTKMIADAYKLELREMLKHLEDTADAADRDAVREYVDLSHDWSGRGLVMFSRAAIGLWYVFSLAVPVRSQITVGQKPHITQLVELDDLYGHYVVAQVDRQGARFFHFRMGELKDQEGTLGEDIHRTRRGRGSSVIGMRGGSQQSGRRQAELVQRNLKDAAAALTVFCERHQPEHLLLAGAEPTLAQFMEDLPIALRDKVVDMFAADMDESELQIRDQSLEIMQRAAEKRHRKVASAVVTAAAKGMNGVVGLDGILSAAHEGRVQVLVVERKYQEPGYRCKGCGYLTTQALARCVFCGDSFLEIPDAVEAVVSQVVEKGGDVVFVASGAMGAAQIGAILRY
jgi:rubrerythrin